MRIINGHIPRTIFGLKYTHTDYNGDKYFNECLKFDTKTQQQAMKKILETQSDMADIVELKWLIKPNDEE